MIERTHNDDIAYFIAFCVEIYKNANKKSGEQTAEIFANYGVMNYLETNYEVLHTQSPQWILCEITDFITEAKK